MSNFSYCPQNKKKEKQMDVYSLLKQIIEAYIPTTMKFIVENIML